MAQISGRKSTTLVLPFHSLLLRSRFVLVVNCLFDSVLCGWNFSRAIMAFNVYYSLVTKKVTVGFLPYYHAVAWVLSLILTILPATFDAFGFSGEFSRTKPRFTLRCRLKFVCRFVSCATLQEHGAGSTTKRISTTTCTSSTYPFSYVSFSLSCATPVPSL